MCLFLDVNLNTSTWTFVLLAASLGAVILGLYNQLNDIALNIHEAKNKNEILRNFETSFKHLNIEVGRLKTAVNYNLEEVNSLQTDISLLKTDKTGLVDFAYKGEVVFTGNTVTFKTGESAMFGFGFCGDPHLERRILESTVMPGDCWPIRGQEGAAVIALTREVLVTKVTLEHAPRGLLPGNTALAAPRGFSLWGLREDMGTAAHFFGQFQFKLDSSEVQTFSVVHSSNSTFKLVEFKVHSNHGHPDFTCVYRVRIHGRLL